MFTRFRCPTCLSDLLQKGGGGYASDEAAGYVPRVSISTTDPAKLVRCTNDHESLLLVYDPGFSLLYQRALQRLATGYARDAVIDAQTALEMFLAHVPVRAVYDRTGSRPSEIRKLLNKAQILDSFERVFGAAVTCAAAVSGQPPVVVDLQKTRNVRNDAVHKGIEPTEAKAETLCFEVERVVLALLDQLDALKPLAGVVYFEADWNERIEEFARDLGSKNYPISHNSLGTVFAFNVSPRPEARKVLAAFRRMHAEGVEAWAIW